MELKDTINLMVSEDYKERFKAEYLQLKTRRDKLGDFLIKYNNGELDFKPTCSFGLLLKQWEFMCSYIAILELRAEIEKIDLRE